MGKTDRTERSSVTVHRDTFDALGKLEMELRVSKSAIVSALTDWFQELPPEIQGAFLDRRRDPSAEVAKMKLASGAIDMRGVTMGDALEHVRNALVRVEILAGAYQEQLGIKAGSDGIAPPTPLKDAGATPPPQPATGGGVTRGGVGQEK